MSFQFTHPGKGATLPPSALASVCTSFNSRTLGRVRRADYLTYAPVKVVSIHAPWEGCDYDALRIDFQIDVFQFTHPGKGATALSLLRVCCICCFNSRTPGGVRHIHRLEFVTHKRFQFTHPGRGATKTMTKKTRTRKFQFTHPGRGATEGRGVPRPQARVSIHAPREGCDPNCLGGHCTTHSFNSRTPGGVRRLTDFADKH